MSKVMENTAQAVDIHGGEVGNLSLQRNLRRHWSDEEM